MEWTPGDMIQASELDTSYIIRRRQSGVTISEASRKYGLTPDTLRYYERIGLIPPVPRTKSGIRDYGEESCGWIELMKCMRAAGVQIEALAEYVALYQQGEAPSGPAGPCWPGSGSSWPRGWRRCSAPWTGWTKKSAGTTWGWRAAPPNPPALPCADTGWKFRVLCALWLWAQGTFCAYLFYGYDNLPGFFLCVPLHSVVCDATISTSPQFRCGKSGMKGGTNR